jgi:hypothetical protein
MHNQINKIQYVDLRDTHYWYQLDSSDLSPALVIKDDENVPMPNNIEPPDIETKKYVYKGRLKYGEFLILKDAHKAHLLFMNTRGTVEHIIPDAKHKEQLRALGLPKEVMLGKGNVAACVRLAHGIRKDPKAWGMAIEPAIPAFVEKLKEVNSVFHSDYKVELSLIEQYDFKAEIVERPKIPNIHCVAVYDNNSDFILYVGQEFSNLDRAGVVTKDFIQRLPRLLKFLKVRNECIDLIGLENININSNLSQWGGFTDADVDRAIEDLEAALIYGDPITLMRAFITRPEIYEAPREPGEKGMDSILLWNCYSQLTETGIALRPSYRGYFKYLTDMTWVNLEKHLGITEELYKFHENLQSLLEADDIDDVVQPHHILRICYRQIMEQKKGIESFTPEGGFDSLE